MRKFISYLFLGVVLFVIGWAVFWIVLGYLSA
jgi:hypothetical protein